MIHALAFALMAVQNPAAQQVKTIDIDRFSTPTWSLDLAKGQSGGNEWFDLLPSQCVFPRRATWVQVGVNFTGGTLTSSLGNHQQKITTTASMTWTQYLQVSTDGISQSVDLSAVENIRVDLSHVPDIPRLTVVDIHGVDSTASWTLTSGGILFKRSNFANNLDWKHIVLLKFRQDFNAFPNPTTYAVTRFYATLKPVALPPAP